MVFAVRRNPTTAFVREFFFLFFSSPFSSSDDTSPFTTTAPQTVEEIAVQKKEAKDDDKVPEQLEEFATFLETVRPTIFFHLSLLISFRSSWREEG